LELGTIRTIVRGRIKEIAENVKTNKAMPPACDPWVRWPEVDAKALQAIDGANFDENFA
jgi:hypothetical protein